MERPIIESKKVMVDEVSEKFSSAQSAVVVEYRGLNVAQLTELRRLLREENIEFKIYKNNIAKRAAQKAGFDDVAESITGPNAFVFGTEDAVSPARILAKFAKDNDKLVLKSGVVEGKQLASNELMQIATLPSRDGLLSMLLSCLQAPVRDFAMVTKAIAEQKEEA